ncbi:isochorismatase family protein [Streptomyces sp. NPDC058864]
MTRLEAQRTALVVIDLMERIVELPLEPRSGEEVVLASLGLATAFREAGAPVVLVRVERPGVDEQPPGSELVEGLEREGDLVIVKRTVGAFHGTGLDGELRARGIDTLVVAGIATNMGVESTARAASDHGYELHFAEDAMSALSGAEHEAAVTLTLPRFGTVAPAAELVKALWS